MQQLLTNKKRKLEEEVPEKMERRFKEITIRLVKPPGGGKLGATVSFDTSNGTYLEIDTIDGGIMTLWNKVHPDKEVKAGDKILSINGHSGNANELAEALKSDTILDLVVQVHEPEKAKTAHNGDKKQKKQILVPGMLESDNILDQVGQVEEPEKAKTAHNGNKEQKKRTLIGRMLE